MDIWRGVDGHMEGSRWTHGRECRILALDCVRRECEVEGQGERERESDGVRERERTIERD